MNSSIAKVMYSLNKALLMSYFIVFLNTTAILSLSLFLIGILRTSQLYLTAKIPKFSKVLTALVLQNF